MKKKRHTVEQIIRILREADSGLRNDEVCLKHNISQQTFYRWKRKYEGMDLKEAQRLRDLEKENSEQKKLLAEQLLKTKALEIALEKTFKPRASAQHGRQGSTGFVVLQARCLSMAGHQPVHLTLSTQTSP
jgi:putative transposase